MKHVNLAALISCLLLDLSAASSSFVTIPVTTGTPWRMSSGARYGLVSTDEALLVLDTQTNTFTGSNSQIQDIWDTSINGTLGFGSSFRHPSNQVLCIDASTGNILGSASNISTTSLNNTFQNATTAWVCSQDGKAYSYDVSNPSNPQLASGSITFPVYAANPLGIAIYGTTSVVAGWASDTLAIVNNQSKEVEGVIELPFGSAPWQVATNPTGSIWAAIQRGSNKVNFFDPFSQTITGTINLSTSPRGVSLNATSCAVGLFSTGKVVLFDVNAPHSIQGTVTLGGIWIRDVLLNGTTGYATNQNGGLINVFDTTTFQVIGTLSVPSAYGLALSGDRLIATSLNDPVLTFCHVGPGTLTLLGTASTSVDNRYPAISGTTCLVPNASDGDVKIFDFLTRSQVGTITNFDGASFAAYGSSYWMVSSQGDNLLSYVDPSLGTITDDVLLGISINDITFNGTTGAIITRDQNLFLFDAQTGATTHQTSLSSVPFSMASSGTIGILSLPSQNVVQLFSMEDASIHATIQTGNVPSNVSVNGNIAVISNNQDNTVSILDLVSGNIINTITVGQYPSSNAALSTKGYVISYFDETVSGFNYVGIEPIPAPAGTGNLKPTADQMYQMSLTGNWSQETADYVNQLNSLPLTKKPIAFLQSGCQRKVLQYQIEKLDLLIHKEIDAELYSHQNQNRIFLNFGFDNLSQASKNGFAGYNVDHYFQFLGGSTTFKNVKWLGALGFSESYEKLKPSDYSASSSYYTIWTNLGASSKHARWSYGLDALFGYSFINAKRTVDVFDLTAYTNHGMWNVSFDAKASYQFHVGKLEITPYDNLGYIYGHENDYTEHGAPGDNLVITKENISMIRNQVGFKLLGPIDLDVLKCFIDGAYVYEYYFSDRFYQQRFVGSTLVANVTQTVPAKNYGRVNTGFEGTCHDFDWRVAYTGLYGQGLLDSAVSVKFGYKF